MTCDIDAVCVSDYISIEGGRVVEISQDGTAVTLTNFGRPTIVTSNVNQGSYVTLTDENRKLFANDASRHPCDAILRVCGWAIHDGFKLQYATGKPTQSTYYRRRYRPATGDEVSGFLAREKQSKQEAQAAKDAASKAAENKSTMEEARQKLSALSLDQSLQLLQEQLTRFEAKKN